MFEEMPILRYLYIISFLGMIVFYSVEKDGKEKKFTGKNRAKYYNSVANNKYNNGDCYSLKIEFKCSIFFIYFRFS